VEDGGNEVGEGFTHARAGFDDDATAAFESAGHGDGHLLLLRAVFEIGGQREFARLGKKFVNLALERRGLRAASIFPQ